MNDINCVKLLVAFGASINPLNKDSITPFDLAYSASHKLYFKRNPLNSLRSWVEISMEEEELNSDGFTVINSPERSNGSVTKSDEAVNEASQHHSQRQFIESEMIQFLKSVGGQKSATLKEDQSLIESRVTDLESTFPPFKMEDAELYNKGAPVRALYKKLEDKMKEEMEEYRSLQDIDELVANTMQQKEMSRYRKTGSRILCLDGGGIKGLIEIDLLHQLEMATGKKITELFDWIVGTSTGGVLAMSLVYGKFLLFYVCPQLDHHCMHVVT